ncbi:MAG: hypothetical protein L0H22_11420, partial [Brevibacterium aurantiacum]|nr:hypothetical protein [Brevibacterium aurantiacum]
MTWAKRAGGTDGFGRGNDRSSENAHAAASLHSGPGGSLPPATLHSDRELRGTADLVIRFVVAAAAGLLAYLAYPTGDLWWTAPFAVAGLILATHRTSWRQGAALGFVFGAALHLPLIGWTGIFLGWVPRGALTLLMAVYAALAGLGLAKISQVRLAVATPLLACWWVLAEAVASRFPWGGFGWSRLAFSQADGPTFGLAALGGAPLVSFAVALAGSLLAAAALAVWRGQGVVPILAFNCAAVAVMGLGAVVPRPAAAEAGMLN